MLSLLVAKHSLAELSVSEDVFVKGLARVVDVGVPKSEGKLIQF